MVCVRQRNNVRVFRKTSPFFAFVTAPKAPKNEAEPRLVAVLRAFLHIDSVNPWIFRVFTLAPYLVFSFFSIIYRGDIAR